MQATMALVEGHAEHVMDAAGAEVLPSLPKLRAAMGERRREGSVPARLLAKLLGLDAKLRQYEQGKAFCDGVVERVGIEGLNRAWSDPAQLPTLAELDDPQAWVDRTAPAAAA
jgi:putative hydrolase